ncbi:MAG: phosphoribosyltransferase [Candidatus Eisenbacteria bacterium]
MRELAFRDRTDAGNVLADELARVLVHPCVVLGIPRGGLMVAFTVAERFRAPLAPAFARKVTLPSQPELAVGALDEDGHLLVDHETLTALGAGPDDLADARRAAALELARERERYEAPRLTPWFGQRTVVIVDDGLATGLTMRAAVAWARRHDAREVVVAVPVASLDAAARLEREADRIVCPWVDETFGAVGGYFRDFAPVTDEQVLEALERARGWAPALPARG